MTRLVALTLKHAFPLLLGCVGVFSHAPDAFALDPKLSLNQYLLDVWTTENGLPQNSVRAILQTRDGYLWLGTAEGLARFDGVRFTVFNQANTAEIKDHSIYSLCEDGEGNLWVGTEYGHLMQFRDGKFTSRQLAQHGVYPLYRDRAGSLWMGVGTEGLARLSDGKLTTWKTSEGLSHDSIRAIYEDKAGRLWIGTNAGLDEFRDGKFIHYTTQQGLSPGRVDAIGEDRQGTLWVGTQVGDADQGGLTEFRDGRFKVWTARDGLSHNGVYRLLGDRAGTLWVGTNGGLNRFRDGRFSALTTKQNLPDDIILSLYEDREGSLWIGMLSGGLARLRDRRFLTYTRADGLSSDDVIGMQADRAGGVWAATTGGLSHIKDGRITRYTTGDGLPDNYVNDIFVDGEDNLWVATDAGVSRFRQGRFQTWTTRDGLSSNSVRSFSQDRAGNIWIGTNRGLDRFRDGQITPYLRNEEVPNFTWTHLLTGRGGELWVGDGSGGLAVVREGKLTNYPRQEGFPHPVSRIYEDRDGCYWIGTAGNGLFRLKDGRFTRYTVKEGLFDNTAWAILEDGQGNFWMSCNRGVYRVSRQELHDFADGKISAVHSVAYDSTDGLKSRECSSGGARTGDGRLWFSTVKGVAVIDPANLRPNAVAPPVVVEGVTVDGVHYPGNVAAQFAPGRHSFEFYYTGLSLLVPQKVRFKYKLEGYDKDWVDAETRRAAYYTNLPPGNYKFRVIAANNDGVWNEAGAGVDFYHKPHFWQTWWFYGLCALALAGAVFGGVRLRVRQMKLREERLVALVKERTRSLVKAKEDTEAALKEVERQKAVIEADNERKTRELDEARALQLSLLPRQLPQLPHLEVAAWMRPATEVGGDYYDFHLNGDGSLVAAIGDATGHGLKAGTMVTATKLLFETLADEQDLRVILQQANQSLRKMKLRGLYMAFALARVDGRGLTVCGAGMPPLLVYRAATARVEEVSLKGMPLGSLSKYAYAQQEFTLASGDVLLLMTDGFAERFNREGEMLGEEKAGAALAAAACLSAQEIIARLVSIGDEWAGERPQDDDVTFVVMKVAAQPSSNGVA